MKSLGGDLFFVMCLFWIAKMLFGFIMTLHCNYCNRFWISSCENKVRHILDSSASLSWIALSCVSPPAAPAATFVATLLPSSLPIFMCSNSCETRITFELLASVWLPSLDLLLLDVWSEECWDCSCSIALWDCVCSMDFWDCSNVSNSCSMSLIVSLSVAEKTSVCSW